jgi:predicted Zn-dependent protease
MVLRRLFASVSENFRFQEAGHHAVNGNTSEAWPIVRRLRERSPNDVTYIILEGDLFLFEKRPDRALDLYRLAERSLRDRQSTDQETKFLLAYAGFRRQAAKYMIRGREFPEWRRFAAAINKMEASNFVKRVFRLPDGTQN